jgi:hypothetical protein
MQNTRSVWGPQSGQYAACAEIALLYRHGMELELELGGSASGSEKETSVVKGGMEVKGGRGEGGVEEAFRGLDIGKERGREEYEMGGKLD